MEQNKIDKILENLKKKRMQENQSMNNSERCQEDQINFDLFEVIIPFMELAEGLTNYSGAQKKNFVLESIKEYARKANIVVDERQMGYLIEDLIKLTKKVNNKR